MCGSLFGKGGNMELGQKIKKIRIFRGMTQRELGIRLGYGRESADVRIAQYESGARVPKRETLSMMANILEVNILNFIRPHPGSAEDLMQLFFWLDEENRDAVQLFVMETGREKTDADSYNGIGFYPDAEGRQPAVGIRFGYGKMDEYLGQWMEKKQQLNAQKISEKEYLEWKWNWPITKRSCHK